jgi:uncharacterized membrane protein (UPF0127 family)
MKGADMVLKLSSGVILAGETTLAKNFAGRLRGLMGRKGLSAGEALILKPCCQIHTFFMRFDIDVIFVDRQGRVLQVVERMPPWRISSLVPQARLVVELPGGSLKASVAPGDMIKLEE